jgi:hypothetical protein
MDLETHILYDGDKIVTFSYSKQTHSDSFFGDAKFDIFLEPFVWADGRISISVERQQCADDFFLFPGAPLLTEREIDFPLARSAALALFCRNSAGCNFGGAN